MFVRSAISIVISILVLAIISWRLTLITLAGVIPTIGMALCIGKTIRRLAKDVQDKKAILGEISEEAMSNIRTVKAFANEKQEADKFRVVNKECYNIGKKMAVIQGAMTFFIQFAINACMAGIIYYSSILVNEGKLTVGEIAAFLLYMIQLIINFAVLALVIGAVFKVMGASEKIIKIMQIIPSVNSKGGNTLEEHQI